MIEAHGLVKRYGSTTAVDDLSFSIRPGLVTGFLGPNGAGKTTTMRMILGLDAPTQGSVTVGGRSYRDLPAPIREVGALLDAKAVHGGRRARDHLLCLAQSNGIARSRVEEVLRIVGLQGVARRRAKGFSLGMGQRLGIAATLLGDPAVLIFDEPVNGLGPDGIAWARTLMRALAAEGRTVLVSSHLMSEMALTADHLLVIGKGRLIADTSADEFTRSSSQQSVHVRSPQAAELAARGLRGRRRRPGRDRPRRHRDHRDGQRRSGTAGRRPWHRPGRAHPHPGLAGGGVHGTDPRQRGVPGDRGDPVTDATIALAGQDHQAAVRAATFGDVLRSEWTKLRSVRSAVAGTRASSGSP
jgi:ABC-2 type transport system ATP-binding protein